LHVDTEKRAALLYTATVRRLTNQVSAWQAERESRRTRPTCCRSANKSCV